MNQITFDVKASVEAEVEAGASRNDSHRTRNNSHRSYKTQVTQQEKDKLRSQILLI